MGAFAHPGSGEWKTMSLDAVVEKSLGILQFDPRYKKNVRVEKQLAADLPPVRIVPEAIQQVLINLVMNAIDAMEATPEPVLKIRTFRSGKFDVIEITDNGHGMTEAVRQKLFDPFFTTKPVGKGTGLGLSIAYNFVQEHGGHIHVRSAPNLGATFLIHLPVLEIPSDTPATGSAKISELAPATQL